MLKICFRANDPAGAKSFLQFLAAEGDWTETNVGFRCPFFWHQNAMYPDQHPLEYCLRMPSEPEPFPIHEPPDPPENPDVPVREPDPEDPGQI
jgi:hypothetical protein